MFADNIYRFYIFSLFFIQFLLFSREFFFSFHQFFINTFLLGFFSHCLCFCIPIFHTSSFLSVFLIVFIASICVLSLLFFLPLAAAAKELDLRFWASHVFSKVFLWVFFYYTSTDFFSSLLFFSSINFIPFLFPSVFFIFCFSCVFHHVFHFSAIFALTPKFF